MLTPCDICGDPNHDYMNCTKEAYLESQDVRRDLEAEKTFNNQCPNCDHAHLGICPCAWCDQLGHIAQDCLAHFADNSMQTRYPKREKVKRTLIKSYECRQCGESHPFNIYCPNVRDPPIVPGECRSCGTTTKEHANNCQYVAIKDNIGLCTYCRALTHRYADCPQRIADQDMTIREMKKNKQNSKKKGKVRIIAGVMTREQDSDSTLPPEGEERRIGMSTPRSMGQGVNILSPHHGEPPVQSTKSP